MAKHPNDMTWQELRDLVSAMSLAALDLSQHLNFTNDLLKEEYKAEAYKRAEEMAGVICSMPYEDHAAPGPIDIVVFGEGGLRRVDIPNAPIQPRTSESECVGLESVVGRKEE